MRYEMKAKYDVPEFLGVNRRKAEAGAWRNAGGQFK
jgi:hypothetical protein